MRPEFIDDRGRFSLEKPEEVSGLYLPMASEKGLKSSVTPLFGGDAKLDQESFLLEPVSIENLHNNRSTRNFWICGEHGAWSVTGASAQQEAQRFTPEQEESSLTAGFMWQQVTRKCGRAALTAQVTSYVPFDENAEVMHIRVTNTGSRETAVRGIAAIPIFGRSADNIRDHRDVTSMLHRTYTKEHGVVVRPTMSFDEKGHRLNDRCYFVMGTMEAKGEAPQAPEGFYPTVEQLIGEGGTFTHPRAVYEDAPAAGPGELTAGRESAGGLRFPQVILAPGESASWQIVLGICRDEEEPEAVISRFDTTEKVMEKLEKTEKYWQDQVSISCHTGNADFDRLMRWVGFQPILRRLFGCSFLPHHDYGRGGRGWRDLWQDCLSLILMDPSPVREMLTANFGGVRADGTNATIIGEGLGNFIADRNGIARVWMDHAMWPLQTLKLYIDQTGDLGILGETCGYFKDPQTRRGTKLDGLWEASAGSALRTKDGDLYEGTILEHLLIENLCAFYEVGAHGICRLRNADWNDALDMAGNLGESVAFTFAYAGNLQDLADLIRAYADQTGEATHPLLAELHILLSAPEASWGSAAEKGRVLAAYMDACEHTVSGEKKSFSLGETADVLEKMSRQLKELLRRQEWLDEGWYNSYYDDHGERVEGTFPDGVHMMLTGQVFAIMCGTATDEQIRSITENADQYLYTQAGGFRLNTDFHALRPDLGRMFGFAYGEKENGAVFSHMAVMYANGLYRRGFAAQGDKALKALADASLDFDKSRIYPAIPEYFRPDGLGRYSYLTGAGSWYLLTLVTQVFGIRGELGDLVLAPQLLERQFDAEGRAEMSLTFAGKRLRVTYLKAEEKAESKSGTVSLYAEGKPLPLSYTFSDGAVRIARKDIETLPDDTENLLFVRI